VTLQFVIGAALCLDFEKFGQTDNRSCDLKLGW